MGPRTLLLCLLLVGLVPGGRAEKKGSADKKETFDKEKAKAGKVIFEKKGACFTCHDAEGNSPIKAPDLNGLYQSKVKLADGRTVTADEAFLRESILKPNANITAGYDPLMPPFGTILSDEEVGQLVEYLKSLGTEEDEKANQEHGKLK